MKTLALLLSLSALLVACAPAATAVATSIPTPIPPTSIPPTDPPAPTATPAAVEAPAAAMADLVGLWWFTWCPCKIDFKPEGSYRITGRSAEETEAEGTFTLQDGMLTWVTSDPLCKELPPATYKAHVTRQDGNIVRLRLELVGSDPCTMRAEALKGTAKLLKP